MSFLEAVLQRTKRIERLLEENYQAVGKGLHEKTTSIEHHLDAPAARQLRFIASVRNKLMHEDGYDYGRNDEGRFLEVCDEIIQYLLDRQPAIQTFNNASPQIVTPAYNAPQYVSATNENPTTFRYETNIPKPKIGRFRKFLMILGGLWLFGFITTIVFYVVFYSVRQSQIQAEQSSENKSQIVKVDDKILDSYVGQYDCKSYKITVSRATNSLRTSSSMATGALSAISETEFSANNYSNGFSGRMKFAKNQKGKIFNLIIVSTNGSQEQCTKIR